MRVLTFPDAGPATRRHTVRRVIGSAFTAGRSPWAWCSRRRPRCRSAPRSPSRCSTSSGRRGGVPAARVRGGRAVGDLAAEARRRPAAGRRVRRRARPDELVDLRGDGPDPARRRGDDRVRRAAARRGDRLAPPARRRCGSCSPPRGSCCSPIRAAGRRTPPAWRSRSPPRPAGSPTSTSPSAPARRSPAGPGWRSRWRSARSSCSPPGVIQGGSALTEPDLLGAAFVVALASSVLPYSLELEALRRLPEAVFGVLMSLEPAVAALAGFVVLGQDLGARELVGDRAWSSSPARGRLASVTDDDLARHPPRPARALLARDRPRAEAVDADDRRADPVERAVHPRLRPLARRPDPRDRRLPLRPVHRPRPGRDGDGAGRVREQLGERLPGALRPLHQRRPRVADARLGGQPRRSTWAARSARC